MDVSEIEFVDDVTVKLVDGMGSDYRICEAARVSTGAVCEPTLGENGLPDLRAHLDEVKRKNTGLINYLMSSRHGSCFEHGSLTYLVEAPIFVAREFMRHRIASYNEVSGRYSQMKPRFYVPKPDRKLVNIGTSARPEFVPGDDEMVRHVTQSVQMGSRVSWNLYQGLLAAGVANEVARMVLPVNLMTKWFVTMNPRGLMNFLSLRVDSPDSAVRSRPQWEIQLVAERMEAEFARLFPITHEAFVKAGRTSP